jgi:hypothetical protein
VHRAALPPHGPSPLNEQGSTSAVQVSDRHDLDLLVSRSADFVDLISSFF